MVFALLVLSLAMIVGGIFAVVLGWDIVLIERGWAMVIAGSVTAAGGAVLLGLCAAIGRLGGLRSEIVALREEMTRLAAPEPPLASEAAAALLAGAAADVPSTDIEARKEDEAAPDLPDFLRQADAATADGKESGERPHRFRAADPDDLLEDRLEDREEPPPSPRPEREAAPSSRPDVRPASGVEEGGLPAFEPEDQADRIPPDAALDGAPAGAGPLPPSAPAEREPSAEAPTVVGTYNSGDNRYVMYSDGSIQAETPEGVFRFSSLEELKEFIASGGEAGAGSR